MQATTEMRQGSGSHLGTDTSDTSSSQGPGCHLVQHLCLQQLLGDPAELGFKTAGRAGASVVLKPLNILYARGQESSLIHFYPHSPQRNAVKVRWGDSNAEQE